MKPKKTTTKKSITPNKKKIISNKKDYILKKKKFNGKGKKTAIKENYILKRKKVPKREVVEKDVTNNLDYCSRLVLEIKYIELGEFK